MLTQIYEMYYFIKLLNKLVNILIIQLNPVILYITGVLYINENLYIRLMFQ